MLIGEARSLIRSVWCGAFVGSIIVVLFCCFGMRNDIQRSGSDGGAVMPRQGKGNNGIIPNSVKAISSYLRIVSSGASTVASTVRSAATAASAVVERDIETNTEQVRL